MVVGIIEIYGNAYDGHTLSKTLEQVEWIAKRPVFAFVDRGYRSLDYKGNKMIHVDKIRRGRTPKSLWRWMKRRASDG